MIIRIVVGLAIVLIGTYVLLYIFLYFYQEKIIFVPTKTIVMTPEEFGIKHQPFRLEVGPGEEIDCWYFPIDDSARTILFCYGNGGNKSRRLNSIRFLLDLGFNVSAFDYRGYGESDGKPSETNCYNDAEAVYRWLVDVKQLTPDRIIIFGRSLGGAVATELATRVPCAGLVVESSFTSAAELSRKMFPYMFAGKLIRHRFESKNKITSINCPLLVTHSAEDEMIPFEMGKKLFDTALQPKSFFEIYGAHNDRDYFSDSSYVAVLSSFLKNPGVDN